MPWRESSPMSQRLQFIQAPRRVMAKLIADRCRLTALSLSTGLAMDVAMREVPPGLSS